MKHEVYRYEFRHGVPIHDIEESLLLAVCAAEGIHGQAQVRMDGGFFLDDGSRACVVDAANAVGHTIAQVFTAFLNRQLKENAYSVERVAGRVPPARAERPRPAEAHR